MPRILPTKEKALSSIEAMIENAAPGAINCHSLNFRWKYAALNQAQPVVEPAWFSTLHVANNDWVGRIDHLVQARGLKREFPHRSVVHT